MNLPNLAETLRSVTLRRRIVQDFCPMASSLEARLADLYWSVRGLQPFVSNEVPYLVNNSGRASAEAATILFQNCLEADPGHGPIDVLELGAGTGLFARFFLSTFSGVCAEAGRDFYDRLVYHVTDRSPRSVAQWSERELFGVHAGHVQPAVCDAMKMGSFGDSLPKQFRAVFANYLLDVLPATIVRFAEGGPDQLLVRTYLPYDPDGPSPAESDATVEQLLELAESGDATHRARLIDLVPALEFETKFAAIGDEPPPYLDRLQRFAHGQERMVLNYGALQCLDGCLARLQPNGFILLNDYGPTTMDGLDGHASSQRFGISTATGVNFPFLDWHLEQSGCVVTRPEEDHERQIHPRLVAPRRLERTEQAFAQCYGRQAMAYQDAPMIEAQHHVRAGRFEQALNAYSIAIERNPLDWHLIGQVAEFVGLRLRHFELGVALCQEALELNPCLSSWLWNVYGDCLYCMNHFDEAHQAYERARRIDSDDVRTLLNLGFTHHVAGRLEDALLAIANGLALDRVGAYRNDLLEKQHEILSALTHRWTAEQQRLTARAGAFS